MRIEAIQPGKRPQSRTRLAFDDGSSLYVLPSVVTEQALFVGLELDDDALSALRQAAGRASARSRAVRIISAAGVSKRDLERRLTQKGEAEADAKAAVEWLDELQLLDDAEVARQVVQRGIARGYGAGRIRQMLYEKQVPKQYWDVALAQIPAMDDELDRFLQKKLAGSTDRRDIDRAIQALARRGHSWSAIRAAVRRYSEQIELEDAPE